MENNNETQIKAETEDVKTEESAAALDEAEENTQDVDGVENQKDKQDLEEEKGNPQEILEQKGIDFLALQEEYRQNNGFTQETKESLLKAGITEEVINNYIEGQKARAEQEINKLAECVGGRERFDNILKWAGKNLEKSEIESIRSVTDPTIVKIILKDLAGRMTEKEGKLPDYVSGSGGKVSVEVFESAAQMQAAILDPRYGKDEAYRRGVMKKISASREAGIDLGC